MMSRHAFAGIASIPLLLALLLAGCAAPSPEGPAPSGSPSGVPSEPPDSVVHYTYDVLNVYPHDEGAFTQGLAFADGVLYEGTGRRGRSTLRSVDLETGVIRGRAVLPADYFGEGIALYDEWIVQLTWRAGVGLVYTREELALIDEFSYDTEGWGVTYDGRHLIMSDGTSALHFLDPDTFEAGYSVDVADAGEPVDALNELEYVNGLVYANVWTTDMIAMIDPADGRVAGWLDLTGLLESQSAAPAADVLNGIAYDAVNDRLFVTGKLWPWLFEIRIAPE